MKDFKAKAAEGAALFISKSKDTKDIQDTGDTLDTRGTQYRLNLKLDGRLKEALADEAWKQRTSITALVNKILLDYFKGE